MKIIYRMMILSLLFIIVIWRSFNSIFSVQDVQYTDVVINQNIYNQLKMAELSLGIESKIVEQKKKDIFTVENTLTKIPKLKRNKKFLNQIETFSTKNTKNVNRMNHKIDYKRSTEKEEVCRNKSSRYLFKVHDETIEYERNLTNVFSILDSYFKEYPIHVCIRKHEALIILVLSKANSYKRRMKIRNTWGSIKIASIVNGNKPFVVETHFFIEDGKISDSNILNEHKIYRDMIWLDPLVSVTSKNVSKIMIETILILCECEKNTHPIFLAIAEDTSFINVPKLLRNLLSGQKYEEELFCGLDKTSSPVRCMLNYGMIVASFNIWKKMIVCSQVNKILPDENYLQFLTGIVRESASIFKIRNIAYENCEMSVGQTDPKHPDWNSSKNEKNFGGNILYLGNRKESSLGVWMALHRMIMLASNSYFL